ncbi:hypothetical protein FLL45_05865 [Aliikangiella marina]|uniref:ZIP family metal transporter n=1 Tax=Aliikangiella marina TaxID=1712262 RepID=A0A545TJT3_9GAMM|nr:hypothetical protein [Aliikangiella marina]TQV77467.1 hypothetical protein FLL45_05865 [Aliikangiella marina]
MLALIACIFALFVGPLVYQTFGPLRRTDKIVSGIVLVVVVGTILFEIIPQSYQAISVFAVLLCLIGFVGPTVVEKSFRKAADTTHKLTILLGIIGLLLHAFIDGMAIQASETPELNSLAIAIILHRLPIGLTIWWLLKPLLGERYALVTLILMGLTTFLGYLSSQALDMIHNSMALAATQAFIAGSLLHVVIHKPHSDGCMHTSPEHDHHHQPTGNVNQSKQGVIKNQWELIGFALGGLLFAMMYFYHH